MCEPLHSGDKRVRESEGWPVKGSLLVRAHTLGATAPSSLLAAVRALEPEWRGRLDAFDPRLEGVIERVIAEGRAGFVRTKDGASFYFRGSDLRGGPPESGQAVTFRTVPGFDRKKNQATTNAVDLRLAA